MGSVERGMHERVKDAYTRREIPNAPDEGVRMIASTRKAINKDISKLTYNTYFREIPLGDIQEICEKNGVIILQEDYSEWSGFLMGADSDTFFILGDLITGRQAEWSGKTMIYTPFKNAMLWMSWYRMGTGRYEIVAYIT